ncbi:MAG: Ig-like domain-containing protein, partial [Chthoniobacteraceae bacterium]
MDLSFDPGSGVNGTVNCLVVQPDGKVIIGGEFSTVQGLVRKSIARLNPDGSGDSSFNGDGSLASAVLALALQPDGKVLVGRESENFGLARLNSDGSPDTIFNANAYAAIASTEPYYPARVSTIVVQPDGRVLYAGETLLRLHSDGTLDTGFISGAVGSVYSMAIQADEKLIVGGYLFNSVTGESRYGLARLNADGSLDDTFNGEAGIDGLFYAIVPQPDGKILVGGGFIAVNGTSDGTIARLNVDGSLDPTFGVISGTWAGGTRGSVNAIALQSDGAFIVGGQFEFIDGSARKNLARLNADGSLDASYPNGAGGAGGFPTGYPGTSVKAVVAWTDGSVFIGGAFTTVHGTNRNRVARLQSDGSVENGFQPGRGLERAVTAFIVQSDGKVVIGGGSSAMARLNADGSRDSDFSSGAGPNADVTSVALQPDGKLLIGGSFTAIDGTPRMALARLNADGSLDADFDAHLEIQIGHDPIPQPYGGEYSTAVTKVLVQADGKILVAGYSLTAITGQEVFAVTARYFLERLDSDGNHDPAFAKAYGDAFDGGGYWSHSWYSYPASALVVQPDGKIVLSGVFNSLDGKNHKGIARLNADGDLDESFIPGSEFHLAVASLALQADGKILAGGGYFGNVNGVETYGIVRFNANGSLDSTFNPGTGIGPWWTGQVSSIALQPDGKVLIAGSFATFDGTNRNGVARINADGTLDFRFDPGAGANGGIASIALLPKGNILIGGNFLAVNGFLGPHMARLFGNDPPSPMGPEIVIEHPLGSRLQDGMANVDFGSVKPGLETERTITIRSIGLTDLTDLLITIDGANAEEFSVASEPASSIPGPDGIGTFTVHFAPLARGPQSAVLHLVSNDDDESPFDIALTGAGENRPPVAAIDSGSTPYATAIDLDVLANDNDPDFDALAITEAANGVNGTATIVDTEAGQRLRYAPGVRFSGVDQLNYTVSDGMGGIAEGTVHVTVARPLEAVVQTLYSTGVTGTNQNPGDGTWKRFGVPSIASNGRVAFTGTLSGPHERNSVVVLGSSRGSEFSNAADYVVAQTGGYVFDDPGVKFASFKDPLLNDSG